MNARTVAKLSLSIGYCSSVANTNILFLQYYEAKFQDIYFDHYKYKIKNKN